TAADPALPTGASRARDAANPAATRASTSARGPAEAARAAVTGTGTATGGARTPPPALTAGAAPTPIALRPRLAEAFGSVTPGTASTAVADQAAVTAPAARLPTSTAAAVAAVAPQNPARSAVLPGTGRSGGAVADQRATQQRVGGRIDQTQYVGVGEFGCGIP